MAKGAQPSDRVMRFLDAAGVAKREKRNNPEKAMPRKERKARAEEAAKAAEEAAQGCGSSQGRRGGCARRELTRGRVAAPWPSASALPRSAPRTASAAR